MISKEHLNLLLDLTARIRQVILRFSKDESVRAVTRRKTNDVTRKIDELAEVEALDYLKDRGISACLVSEESDVRILGDKPEIAVVIDPLDGTMNFVKSIPFYAVSVAAGVFKENMKLQDLTAGVVRDVVTGEVISAARGLGSCYNSQRFSLRHTRPSSRPLISFYSYGRGKLPFSIVGLQQSTRFRTLGCASLEICYVALGRLEAMVDVRRFMRLVDFAAAKIILEEAGGLLTDIKGNEIDMKLDDRSGISLIAASNRSMHQRLLNLCKA